MRSGSMRVWRTHRSKVQRATAARLNIARCSYSPLLSVLYYRYAISNSCQKSIRKINLSDMASPLGKSAGSELVQINLL